MNIGFWTLKVKCTQYGICWISGLQECKGIGFLEVGWAGNNFRSGPKDLDFLDGRLLVLESTSPEKFVGGNLTSFKRETHHDQIQFRETCQH